MTVTVILQMLLPRLTLGAAGTVPLTKLTLVAVKLGVPPQVLPVSAVTVTPLGILSVIFALVIAVVLKLRNVSVKVEVAPALMVLGANALATCAPVVTNKLAKVVPVLFAP